MKRIMVIVYLSAMAPAAWAGPEDWSLEGHVGHLNTQATEYVYNSGRKSEEFSWKTENALIAGGQLNFAAQPGLVLGIGGWSLLDASSSGGSEYWGDGYTGQSIYRETVAEHAYRFDASAKVLLADGPQLDFFALGGYRREGSKWSSYGGRYSYTDGVAGTYPDDALKVTYEQAWNMPYFGVSATYVNGPWEFEATLLGSPTVYGRDEDFRTKSGRLYVTDFDRTSMLGAKLDTAYDLGGGAAWTIHADYQHIATTKGVTDIFADGEVIGWSDGMQPGAKSSTIALSTGISVDLCGCKGDRRSLAASGPLRMEGYIGHLSAEAGEFVYDDGATLSQLDWKVKHGLIAGGMLHYDVKDWLTVSGGGWSLIDADNKMDDYDWLLPTDDWSDWSHHEDTRSDYGYQLDLSATARIADGEKADLFMLAGYRRSGMKWSAYGGSYIYSDPYFRNTHGDFTDGELGITYSQTWHIPYAGLSAVYDTGPWQIAGTLYASPHVTGSDEDLHANRKLLFREKFDPTTMIGSQLDATYELTDNSRWTLHLDYQRIARTKADTSTIDLDTGDAFYDSMGSAGASFRSLTLATGVEVRF